MTDFLQRLVVRTLKPALSIQPRLASRFEPASAAREALAQPEWGPEFGNQPERNPSDQLSAPFMGRPAGLTNSTQALGHPTESTVSPTFATEDYFAERSSVEETPSSFSPDARPFEKSPGRADSGAGMPKARRTTFLAQETRKASEERRPDGTAHHREGSNTPSVSEASLEMPANTSVASSFPVPKAPERIELRTTPSDGPSETIPVGKQRAVEAPDEPLPLSPALANDIGQSRSLEFVPKVIRQTHADPRPTPVGPPWPTASASAQARQEPPTIRVTIGRVEIRAVSPPPASVPRPRPRPRLSLEDYLKRRQSANR